jgi:RNA polymerase sigma factor (sigma-70 family)
LGDMIITETTPMKEYTDAELVSRSVAGDRDAFSRIVSRYQILICSLAYNRLGNLGQSEDVAQETFITAWKHLRLLREPEKLRSWLCGIVRNRLHKYVQRETREPASRGDSLELVQETPNTEAQPSEQAIDREEEAILWRALERMPELYREPLILYYRENQSINEVALALELTEDTVKQRLSRGRKLLQEEVQAFVEQTLRRTAPGQKFSGAVLAALPIAPAATVGGGAVGKGAAVAKGGFLGMSLVSLAPFFAMFAGLVSQWFLIRATSTGRQRRIQLVKITAFFILAPGSVMVGENVVSYLSRHHGWSDQDYYFVRTGFWWLFTAGLSAWLVSKLRWAQAVHQRIEAGGNLPIPGTMNLKPLPHACMVAGTELTMFVWLISIAYGVHDLAAATLITGLMVVLGTWNFMSARRLSGAGVAQAAISHMAVYGIIVLMVFNLHLDVWMAHARGVSLDEIHALYPQWIVPSLSLALVLWITLVWRMTRPGNAVVGGETVKAV